MQDSHLGPVRGREDACHVHDCSSYWSTVSPLGMFVKSPTGRELLTDISGASVQLDLHYCQGLPEWLSVIMFGHHLNIVPPFTSTVSTGLYFNTATKCDTKGHLDPDSGLSLQLRFSGMPAQCLIWALHILSLQPPQPPTASNQTPEAPWTWLQSL